MSGKKETPARVRENKVKTGWMKTACISVSASRKAYLRLPVRPDRHIGKLTPADKFAMVTLALSVKAIV
ncbi:hypothetical protein [Pantoea sp. AS142]|uniref:hypothetical protein n=1 Tax=Pantoea sp. AS142 TaxID=3081292 RepID=UPI00301627A7